jgi:hypothetical protein
MTRSQEDLEDRVRRVLDQAAKEIPISPATWHGPRPGAPPRRLPRLGVSNVTALAGIAVAVVVAIVAVSSLHGPAGGLRHHPGATPSQQTTQNSPTTPTSQRRSTTQAGATAGGVERAILRQKNDPRPTAASCRAPTDTERANATIGGADSSFFSCRITLDGKSARFYVQVILSNGSFIAERERRTQQQIFGCCVARTSR